MRGGSRKACDIGFLTDGRREVARNRIGTRLCQSMDRRLEGVRSLQVPPSRNKPLCFLKKGSTGVFFVLFTPVASVCNHFYPFPSPWSAAWRPEYSKYEKFFICRIMRVRSGFVAERPIDPDKPVMIEYIQPRKEVFVCLEILWYPSCCVLQRLCLRPAIKGILKSPAYMERRK